MAKVYTTEITSEHIPSDNPIHQRLFKAYVIAKDFVEGDVLEVGCGEGRGIPLLMEGATSYAAIDKIESVIDDLQRKYPTGRFMAGNIPPFHGIEDNSFDRVFSFQVIEHIRDDAFFLKEIFRVLKPGGRAVLTTPNRKMSLTRNPWHVREYEAAELLALSKQVFAEAEVKGITGNKKVMDYYEQNRRSVQRITRWDFLNLQYRLPAAVLRLPYEMLNRWNRNKLQRADTSLVTSIAHTDFVVTDDAANALDLLLVVKK